MNILRALWLRICRFFVDSEFDAAMEEMADEEMALIRSETRRPGGA